MSNTPETTTSGREPETTQQTRVSIRGQHKTPAHSDHSSKFGKQHERIIALTFPGRHPLYEKAFCPECGAAIRWLPLGANGNLVPRCSNEKCMAMLAQKSGQTAKPTPKAILERQWRKVGRGRC